MDLGGVQEPDVTMPISVNYGPIHESSKLKMLSGVGPASGGGVGGNGGPPPEELRPAFSENTLKKAVKYRECLKNHAASMGGHALDGCGEFMPSGEEGSLEALKCAACDCHRNFHRREIDGEPSCYCFSPRKDKKSPNDCEEQDIGMIPAPFMYSTSLIHPSLNPLPVMKKRFRTKFSGDQKDKMGAFAEKLGWRIQKQDEAAVQQFCAEVGVKRHVLKVWMHNNKHTVGKKMLSSENGVGYLDNGGSPTNSNGMHA